MMSGESLKMILTYRGNQVKRKFDSSFKKTCFWKKLQELNTLKIRNVLGSIYSDIKEGKSLIKEIFDSNGQIFESERELPWYLDLIASKLKSNKIKFSRVVVKSCEGYFFWALYSNSGSGTPKLLLPPFFHRIHPPDTPSEIEEQKRGIADTILMLAQKLAVINANNGDKNTFKDLLCWFEINLHITQKKIKENVVEFMFQPEVYWNDSPVDEKKHCINLESVESEDKSILIVSPNFRKALNDLSETWHALFPKSILLCAWTGSGKERLKHFLTYALRLRQKEILDFSAPQIASQDEPLSKICENLKSRHLIKENRSNRKCKRCLLFFDEIQHDSAKKLREILLRFMEEQQLYDKTKMIDCKQIIFLFAGSKPPDELKTKEPPDFWTRIEKTVLLKHPLLLNDKKQRRNTLIQYFCLFWRINARKILDTGNLPNDFNKIFECMQDPKCLKNWSFTFAKELDSALIPLASIRVMRSIVNRLFNRAIYHIITTQLKEKGKISRAIQSKLSSWIIEIFQELATEINPKGVF